MVRPTSWVKGLMQPGNLTPETPVAAPSGEVNTLADLSYGQKNRFLLGLNVRKVAFLTTETA